MPSQTDIFDALPEVFLGIPLYSSDVIDMIFRFGINIVMLTFIIRFLYYPTTRRKDYLFTYYLIGITVFFICFKMKKYELDMGMAFGLLAIFGIIRYRTAQIEIKEMTYLFVVIGISVINSLANENLSYAEMAVGNSFIIFSIAIIEKCWPLKNRQAKDIIYDNIENTLPQNYQALKMDIEQRTGLAVEKIDVGAVDFLKGQAKLKVFYFEKK